MSLITNIQLIGIFMLSGVGLKKALGPKFEELTTNYGNF
jgi:hypothetical protein